MFPVFPVAPVAPAPFTSLRSPLRDPAAVQRGHHAIIASTSTQQVVLNSAIIFQAGRYTAGYLTAKPPRVRRDETERGDSAEKVLIFRLYNGVIVKLCR